MILTDMEGGHTVDRGANHWPAGHTLDVATLYPLALEKAPAGAQLFAATEDGIPVREIAETIGRRLDTPAVSIPAGRCRPGRGAPAQARPAGPSPAPDTVGDSAPARRPHRPAARTPSRSVIDTNRLMTMCNYAHVESAPRTR